MAKECKAEYKPALDTRKVPPVEKSLKCTETLSSVANRWLHISMNPHTRNCLMLKKSFNYKLKGPSFKYSMLCTVNELCSCQVIFVSYGVKIIFSGEFLVNFVLLAYRNVVTVVVNKNLSI